MLTVLQLPLRRERSTKVETHFMTPSTDLCRVFGNRDQGFVPSKSSMATRNPLPTPAG